MLVAKMKDSFYDPAPFSLCSVMVFITLYHGLIFAHPCFFPIKGDFPITETVSHFTSLVLTPESQYAALLGPIPVAGQSYKTDKLCAC